MEAAKCWLESRGSGLEFSNKKALVIPTPVLRTL